MIERLLSRFVVFSPIVATGHHFSHPVIPPRWRLLFPETTEGRLQIAEDAFAVPQSGSENPAVLVQAS